MNLIQRLFGRKNEGIRNETVEKVNVLASAPQQKIQAVQVVQPAQETLEQRTTKDYKVLIVEDNEKNLAALRYTLENGRERGFSYYDSCFKKIDVTRSFRTEVVDVAEDYESAIKLIREREYDCLITDIFMPRRKGSGDKTLGEKVIKQCESFFASKDYDDEAAQLLPKLKKYFEEGDENNQPLGVLLIEEAQRRNIHTGVATSETGHGSVGLPIKHFISGKFESRGETPFYKRGGKLALPLNRVENVDKSQPEGWYHIISEVITDMITGSGYEWIK